MLSAKKRNSRSMCLYMNVPNWINIKRFSTAISASASQLFEVSLVLFLLNCKSSRHRQRHSGTQECRKYQDKAIMPSITSNSAFITNTNINTNSTTSSIPASKMSNVVPTISAGVEITKISETSSAITAICALTEPRSSSLASCVALDVGDMNRSVVTIEDS
ncbi:hypothetical protein GQX74_015736 [Glossina fuscipes]|nr:hypothetical protein GQX74_015736 [Glossina fuscipes]